jgi:TPR repeat protein
VYSVLHTKQHNINHITAGKKASPPYQKSPINKFTNLNKNKQFYLLNEYIGILKLESYYMIKYLKLSGIVLSFCLIGCAAPLFEGAEEHAIRIKAEQGDVNSQFQMGERRNNPDSFGAYQAAVMWYTKAAEQGHAEAMLKLGGIYNTGGQSLVGRWSVEKDYKEALKWFTKAAEKGNSDAQNNIGIYYEYGKEVPQDYKEALKWYTKAAEQGNAYARMNIGHLYRDGLGVPKSDSEADKWFMMTESKELIALRNAANKGDANAQFKLAEHYDKITWGEALYWYAKAAQQGNPGAQNNLGLHYVDGKGVQQDYKIALDLYTKAAQQGMKEACYNIGLLYHFGYGVPQSDTEAEKWFAKSGNINGYYRGTTYSTVDESSRRQKLQDWSQTPEEHEEQLRNSIRAIKGGY